MDNADKQDIGLLTTWDLYRLARGFLRNNWSHEQVRDLFYRNGRIPPVPSNYKFLGAVDEFWEKVSALSIKLESGGLKVGDRVAYELPVDFLEESVGSLQLEGGSVNEAKEGSVAGVKTTLTRDQAKKGVRVYVVTESVRKE